MPASDNSTQRTQALALLKRRGMTRLAEFSEAGITATTVGRMERAGEVVRLARGLYQLPDAALDAQQSLAEAARLVPKGVICLASALAFHGLTDQMPPKVWIAIGRKDWRPRVEAIREEVEYGGSRIRTTAALAGARIPITVDIGFGDAVEPGVEDIDLPALLDMPSPHLRAYPPETVIAEKFHAMVVLGRANSRMKDYYDVWMLTSAFDIEHERLSRAIVATFARRSTVIPAEVPDGLSDAFATDSAKQRQWDAFARNLSGTIPGFGLVVSELRQRLAGFLAVP
jgi:hypothetical protein